MVHLQQGCLCSVFLMRSQECWACAASDKQAKDAAETDGGKWTAGSCLHLSVFQRMREEIHVITLLSAKHMVQMTTTVTWDKAGWLLNLTVFSSVHSQPSSKSVSKHHPCQIASKWLDWGKTVIEILKKTPLCLCNSQFLNVYVSMQSGTDVKWKSEKLESIFVWFDGTLARPRDRQTVAQIILAGCAACFLP